MNIVLDNNPLVVRGLVLRLAKSRSWSENIWTCGDQERIAEELKQWGGLLLESNDLRRWEWAVAATGNEGNIDRWSEILQHAKARLKISKRFLIKTSGLSRDMVQIGKWVIEGNPFRDGEIEYQIAERIHKKPRLLPCFVCLCKVPLTETSFDLCVERREFPFCWVCSKWSDLFFADKFRVAFVRSVLRDRPSAMRLGSLSLDEVSLVDKSFLDNPNMILPDLTPQTLQLLKAEAAKRKQDEEREKKEWFANARTAVILKLKKCTRMGRLKYRRLNRLVRDLGGDWIPDARERLKIILDELVVEGKAQCRNTGRNPAYRWIGHRA
jgi:hypothetical protein